MYVKKMATSLSQPPSMEFSGAVAANWKKFRQRFELYLDASGKAGENDKVKTSLLLHIIGEEGLDIYNTFSFPAANEDNDPSMTLKIVLDKFEEYCNPKKNVTLERFHFNQCNQGPGETIDHYVTKLKQLSLNCEYDELRDSLIRDRIICGISDNVTRERLLRTKELDLKTCVDYCKAAETVKVQAQQITSFSAGESTGVNAVSTKKGRKYVPSKVKTQAQTCEPKKKCNRCGSNHDYGKCPAFGKKCLKCGLQGHFRKCCKTKKQHAVDQSDSPVLEESDCVELFTDSVQVHSVHRVDCPGYHLENMLQLFPLSL